MTIKVLALTRYDRLGASSRLRIYQFVPYLHNMGIHVEVSPLLGNEYIDKCNSGKRVGFYYIAKSYIKRLFVLLSAKKYNLLWIEKELFPEFPSFIERLLSVFNVRYVVDFDDAIFHNYDISKNYYRRLLRNKISKIMFFSSCSFCGNPYLLDKAIHAGALMPRLLPTVIDLHRYTISRKHAGNPIVIGWIGTPSTVKYLRDVLPALYMCHKELSIQLNIVGATLEDPNLNVVCIPWSEESEVENIQNFDIGIMPLIDSPWERGKCGYKLIQYMACGIPVVASPVGVNKDIVEDGVNGFIPDSSLAWHNALSILVSSSKIRQRFGDAGRKAVEDKYSVQVIYPIICDVFESIAEPGVKN